MPAGPVSSKFGQKVALQKLIALDLFWQILMTSSLYGHMVLKQY